MQRTRIDWVAEQSKLLRGIAEEFTRTQPFAGLTIGTGIHLEAKTVALLKIEVIVVEPAPIQDGFIER